MKLTKAALQAYVERRRRELQEEHRFSPDNGWAQLIGTEYRPVQEARKKTIDYGEYDALAKLADYFDL